MDPISAIFVMAVLGGLFVRGVDIATDGLFSAEVGAGVRGVGGFAVRDVRDRWGRANAKAREVRGRTRSGRAVQGILDDAGAFARTAGVVGRVLFGEARRFGSGARSGWETGRDQARSARTERRGDEPWPIVRAARSGHVRARERAERRARSGADDPNENPNEAERGGPNGQPERGSFAGADDPTWYPYADEPTGPDDIWQGPPVTGTVCDTAAGQQLCERCGERPWTTRYRDPWANPLSGSIAAATGATLRICDQCARDIAGEDPLVTRPAGGGEQIQRRRCTRCDRVTSLVVYRGDEVICPMCWRPEDDAFRGEPGPAVVDDDVARCFAQVDRMVGESVATSTGYDRHGVGPNRDAGPLVRRRVRCPNAATGDDGMCDEHRTANPNGDPNVPLESTVPNQNGDVKCGCCAQLHKPLPPGEHCPDCHIHDQPTPPTDKWSRWATEDMTPCPDHGRSKFDASGRCAPSCGFGWEEDPLNIIRDNAPTTRGTSMADINTAPAAIAAWEAFAPRWESLQSRADSLQGELDSLRNETDAFHGEVAAAADSMGDFAIGGEIDTAMAVWETSADTTAAKEQVDNLVANLATAKEAMDSYIANLHAEYDASIEAAAGKAADAHSVMQEA